MMQQTKKKMVLEHLVVRKMNAAADLKQVKHSLSAAQQLCPTPACGVHAVCALTCMHQHSARCVDIH